MGALDFLSGLVIAILHISGMPVEKPNTCILQENIFSVTHCLQAQVVWYPLSSGSSGVVFHVSSAVFFNRGSPKT